MPSPISNGPSSSATPQPIEREARLQLALPPGGVVSRATLWINGEEREAAYGGRGEVRAAYQQVAVQQRRDPLLVTTKGADRVLAQAFPGSPQWRHHQVQDRHHGTAGAHRRRRKARLMLPAIVDRNFSFAADASHSVWIESKQALAASCRAQRQAAIDGRLFRIAGVVDDRDLLGHAAGDHGRSQPRCRPARGAPRRARAHHAGGRARRAGAGRLDARRRRLGAPRGSTAELIAALDAIPPGTRVGVIIARSRCGGSPSHPGPTRRSSRREAVRSTSFVGGQDNAPALADALQMLEAEPHGDAALDSRTAADQLPRQRRPPRAGGRAARRDCPTSCSTASSRARTKCCPTRRGPGARVRCRKPARCDRSRGFLPRTHREQTPSLAIRRSKAPATDGATKGSDHIARLWASDRVLELMRTDRPAIGPRRWRWRPNIGWSRRSAAPSCSKPSSNTTTSRLTPVSQATVPTVPEPHEWALAPDRVRGADRGSAWRNRQPSCGGRDASASASRRWSRRQPGTPGAGISRASRPRPRRRLSLVLTVVFLGVLGVRTPVAIRVAAPVAARAGRAPARSLCRELCPAAADHARRHWRSRRRCTASISPRSESGRRSPSGAWWRSRCRCCRRCSSCSAIRCAWCRRRSTVGLLQAQGLAVARQGTFLLWRDEMVQFDAPCSGVNMLWAGLLLTLMGCVLFRLGAMKVAVAVALSRRACDRLQCAARIEPVLCRERASSPRPRRGGTTGSASRPSAVGRRHAVAARATARPGDA